MLLKITDDSCYLIDVKFVDFDVIKLLSFFQIKFKGLAFVSLLIGPLLVFMSRIVKFFDFSISLLDSIETWLLVSVV